MRTIGARDRLGATDRLAILILAAFGIACLGLGGAVLWALDGPTADDPGLLFVIVPAGTGLVALACLMLPAWLRMSAVLTILAALVAAFGAELYLSGRAERAPPPPEAGKDPRSVKEVVRDLRAGGESAYPVAFGRALLSDGEPRLRARQSNGESAPILPLGGIANAKTVYCNEGGPYLVYTSDEHGFHNPPGLWSRAPVEVAAVGDSFTLGACVASEKNMLGRIRERYPLTVNLGMAGNGPLLELAAVKEYLPSLRPRIVLWFFYEGNDLTKDIFDEEKSALLRAYLAPGFTQRLIERQGAIDAALTEEIERRYAAESAAAARARARPGWRDVLLLRALRNALGLGLGRANLSLFQAVLIEAKRTVESWDGRLYVVYLAGERRYAGGFAPLEDVRQRARILSLLRALDIPVIDIHERFAATGRPRSLYQGHFNEEGHQRAADAILEALAREPTR